MTDREIDLPPLPHLDGSLVYWDQTGKRHDEGGAYKRETLQAYARAAILADRAARAAKDPWWFAIEKETLRLVEVPYGTPGAFAFDLRNADESTLWRRSHD